MGIRENKRIDNRIKNTHNWDENLNIDYIHSELYFVEEKGVVGVDTYLCSFL